MMLKLPPPSPGKAVTTAGRQPPLRTRPNILGLSLLTSSGHLLLHLTHQVHRQKHDISAALERVPKAVALISGCRENCLGILFKPSCVQLVTGGRADCKEAQKEFGGMLEILYLDCSGVFVRVNFIAYTLKKMNKQTIHVCAPNYFRLDALQGTWRQTCR